MADEHVVKLYDERFLTIHLDKRGELVWVTVYHQEELPDLEIDTAYPSKSPSAISHDIVNKLYSHISSTWLAEEGIKTIAPQIEKIVSSLEKGATACPNKKCWRDDDGKFYLHITSEGASYGKEVCPVCNGRGYIMPEAS